jgi:hypothetical protein
MIVIELNPSIHISFVCLNYIDNSIILPLYVEYLSVLWYIEDKTYIYRKNILRNHWAILNYQVHCPSGADHRALTGFKV